jgi:hypothetical protein
LKDLKKTIQNLYVIDYDRLLNECFDTHFNDKNGTITKSWMKVHGTALIDNELLSKSKYFIGNIFSTFSNIVFIKRDHSSSFLQTRFQYFIENFLLYWLALGIFITSFAIYRIIKVTCYRNKHTHYTRIV